MMEPTENGARDNVGEGRFLLFTLGEQEYAIPLRAVREAIALPANVTPVPHSQSHFLGIIDLRGTVVPLVDLRVKFGLKAKNNDDTAVAICGLSSALTGLVVSSISAVMSLEPSEISGPPDVQSTRDSAYILGVTRRNGKLILLLDIDKVLDHQDHAKLAATARPA